MLWTAKFGATTMNTISLTAKTARHRSITDHPISTIIAEFCAGAREGLEIQARYDALARKSDKELAALGLTRDEIGRAAVTGKIR
jgi:hypothetical protein